MNTRSCVAHFLLLVGSSLATSTLTSVLTNGSDASSGHVFRHRSARRIAPSPFEHHSGRARHRAAGRRRDASPLGVIRRRAPRRCRCCAHSGEPVARSITCPRAPFPPTPPLPPSRRCPGSSRGSSLSQRSSPSFPLSAARAISSRPARSRPLRSGSYLLGLPSPRSCKGGSHERAPRRTRNPNIARSGVKQARTVPAPKTLPNLTALPRRPTLH